MSIKRMSKRTFRGVLEAAVNHSTEDLRFQNEIAEVGRVNAHIVPPSTTNWIIGNSIELMEAG
jgi:hypothetical protein